MTNVLNTSMLISKSMFSPQIKSIETGHAVDTMSICKSTFSLQRESIETDYAISSSRSADPQRKITWLWEY
jgi:hypothetical protein